MAFLERLFGDPNAKTLKTFTRDVEAINALESQIQTLSDTELTAKTTEFRKRLAEGVELESLRHEAFAVVREAARRTLGQRHYDVQLMGGLALHSGAIAEMRTGEGKTLTATTAAYLNALTGQGVHLVTVNDYLARRDADWMGQVYALLGLTVGCIQANNNAFQYDVDIEAVKRSNTEHLGTGATETHVHEDGSEHTVEVPSTEGSGYEALIVADMDHLRVVSRREAYACDVVFGTNNEFGFDYLRDNMVLRPEDRVQRGLAFAIIDEVDSILIDEARTPLIISAPAADATQQYYQFAELVGTLTPEEDYTVDEKQRTASLTQEGIARVEKALGVENLYVETSIRTVHHIENALKARSLFLRDKEYVVQGDEVIIIDEFTGRMMHGRRYSEGLHQAIEAKERVKIQQESQTLATITLQNYFRLYTKISGMTGTGDTEREEFFKIYGLNVVVIPTHRENVRIDYSDRIYKNQKGKYEAVIERVKELHENGQPVLIGTVSIEQNEVVGQFLSKAGIPHNILNAKNHEREAEVIAQAGKSGAVTVATNMAGRGVDIILGGNPVNLDDARRVREAGGLVVLGTERHESRRIDNQLRGRAARQGDPGMSQFFVSMEDDLMRIFAADRMKSLMERMGVPDDMPIENSMITRSIEQAQKKVESRNFDIRKHLVEYDDVVNKQRETIYRRRNVLLDGEISEVMNEVDALVREEIAQIVSLHTNDGDVDYSGWNLEELTDSVVAVLPLDRGALLSALQAVTAEEADKVGEVKLRTAFCELIEKMVNEKFQQLREMNSPETFANALRQMMLRVMDVLWIAHLDEISFLRDSINLRGYGQRDPLVEYKKESYELFQQLLENIQRQIVQQLFAVAEQAGQFVAAHSDDTEVSLEKAQYSAPEKEMERQGKGETFVSGEMMVDGEKVGRNDPCPCGSGKKYKKCHGATE